MNKWMTGALAATLVVSFAPATPAAPPTQEIELKSPATAQGLSLGVPVLTLFGGGALAAAASMATGASTASPAITGLLVASALLTPMAFGTGYFYAGDPVRGLLVGLGGTGLLGGAALAYQLVGSDGYAFALISAPLIVVTALGYGLWVSHDVYWATQRMNELTLMRAGRPSRQWKPGDEVD